jgi:hypothetical protein
VKSRRATPQLDLFSEPSEVDPRRASARAQLDFDQSPFDPTEFDEVTPPARGRGGSRLKESFRSIRPEEAPAARTAIIRKKPTRLVTVSYDHAHRLASELRVLTGSPVRLHVHDNRSTMVSFRREDEQLQLRVHHMFLKAGPDVVRALADYARARSVRAGRVLDRFVRQNREHIKPIDAEEARSKPLRTQGEVYDLSEVYDSLNRRYFGGTVDARIGWGRGSTNRRRRSIRMGAYYHDTATILIHPALDRAEVPRYFLELVVYHEMLHQAVPQQRTSSGRRCIHSDEFREREALFEDYERARLWERRNLQILLRPARARV